MSPYQSSDHYSTGYMSAAQVVYPSPMYTYSVQSQQLPQQLPAISTMPYSCPPSDLSESSESSGEQQAAKKKRQLTSPEDAMYTCQICGKNFGRVWNYKAHQDTHDSNRRKEFSCTHCPKDFVRKNDLDRHITSKHLKTKDFECEMCGRKFARKDTLQRHESDGCPNRERQGKAKGSRSPEGTTSQPQVSSYQVYHGTPYAGSSFVAGNSYVPRTVVAIPSSTPAQVPFSPQGGTYIQYAGAPQLTSYGGNGYYHDYHQTLDNRWI